MSKNSSNIDKLLQPRAFMPDLTPDAEAVVAKASALTPNDLHAIVLHLRERLRTDGLEASSDCHLETGDFVRIVSGPPKHVGSVARVIRAQRQRCYVRIPGHATEVYLFKADVVKIDPSEAHFIPLDTGRKRNEISGTYPAVNASMMNSQEHKTG